MPALVHAIDVASYQLNNLSDIIREHQPEHVIVRLYLPEERISQDCTRQEIAVAREAGCTIGGYVWCYVDLDPRKTVRDAVELGRSCGLELPVLWLDCETYREGGAIRDRGPDAAWLRAAVDEARSLGVQPGIYTGGWWWHDFMDNTTEFADLPLWAAEYCEPAHPASCTLFGGWTRACGKQWSEKLPDGRGLDRDVFLEEVCASGPRTIEQVEATNSNIRQQLADWQQARRANDEDPYDYEAFRAHLRALDAPDSGPREFVGFRRRTLQEVEAANSNIRQQIQDWRQARVQNGEDPNDYPACREHLMSLGAPDPGEQEFDGFTSIADARAGRAAAARAAGMTFDSECGCIFQSGSWQCSAASSAWVLQSMGIPWGQDDVVQWLGVGTNISPAVGLYEGSGRMLAELFKAHGLDAGYGALSWASAIAMAGRQPFCMSGGQWYHWSAVRSTDGQGLLLANPAPNWYGVGQYMDYDEWQRLGPWNAAWVNVPIEDTEDPTVIADLQATIERLRSELEMRERRDEELIRTMGYIHGDVVGAFRTAHTGLKQALEAANAAAPLREDIRSEANGHLQAAEAATHTLEVHTQP